MKFPVVDGLRTLELGTPGSIREWLNGLVLEGEKRATAGTTDDYEDNEKEYVGERLALVNDDLVKVGIVEVTGVVETTFGEVPWSFAQAEGEGDTSIEEWRAGHRSGIPHHTHQLRNPNYGLTSGLDRKFQRGKLVKGVLDAQNRRLPRQPRNE